MGARACVSAYAKCELANEKFENIFHCLCWSQKHVYIYPCGDHDKCKRALRGNDDRDKTISTDSTQRKFKETFTVVWESRFEKDKSTLHN